MTRYTEFVELLASPLREPFLLVLAQRLCIMMRDVDAKEPESIRRFAAYNEVVLVVLSELMSSKVMGIEGYAPDTFVTALRERAERGGAVGDLQDAVESAMLFARAERERRESAAPGM